VKRVLAVFFAFISSIAAPSIVFGQAQLTNIISGYSGGAGLVSDLRRVIEPAFISIDLA
jgi:hypothetical protein